MKRIFYYCLIFVMIQNIVLGQIKRDPRSVAMANAYGTIADGFFAVGYNPAMLAYQQDKPFMLQLTTKSLSNYMMQKLILQYTRSILKTYGQLDLLTITSSFTLLKKK